MAIKSKSISYFGVNNAKSGNRMGVLGDFRFMYKAHLCRLFQKIYYFFASNKLQVKNILIIFALRKSVIYDSFS